MLPIKSHFLYYTGLSTLPFFFFTLVFGVWEIEQFLVFEFLSLQSADQEQIHSDFTSLFQPSLHVLSVF